MSADPARWDLRRGNPAGAARRLRGDEEVFRGLSSETMRWRFFGGARPAEKLLKAFYDPSDLRKQLSLIVTRIGAASRQITATGNYVALDDNTAEVAMVVDDSFQG